MFGFWYNLTFFSLLWLIVCNMTGLSWLVWYAGYFLIIAEAMRYDIKRSLAQ